jgi:hypothetical protein
VSPSSYTYMNIMTAMQSACTLRQNTLLEHKNIRMSYCFMFITTISILAFLTCHCEKDVSVVWLEKYQQHLSTNTSHDAWMHCN